MDEDTKAMADAASKWAGSHEGQKALEEIAARSQRIGRELDRACRVDPESMRKPMTM